MNFPFEKIFEDITVSYVKAADAHYTNRAICILVPPDHAPLIQRWNHDFVKFYISEPNAEDHLVAFNNPGDCMKYLYLGVEIKLIVAAHEDHASKVYLDAVKEHGTVNT